MKRRLDSIIIGGAMLVGSMAHRRTDHVAKQVDDLGEAIEAVGEAIEAVEEQIREVDARAAERPPIPGMPLPTGYGLQVRGPDNENIILPVCLPPGFELDSMVLCPEFLPRDQQQPATVAAAPAPAPVTPAAAAAAPTRPTLLPETPRERMSGTLQYVFGTGDAGFSMDETFGGAVDAAPPAPRRASGVETHHLA